MTYSSPTFTASENSEYERALQLRPQYSDRTIVFALTLASTLLAVAYAVLIRPGTAYDEPAHLNNVQQYAAGRHMPVMGRVGVSYEAYQAPLYYVVAGRIYAGAATVGGESAGYRAVQFLGLLLLPVAVVLGYKTARLIFPCNAWQPRAVALFLALNPGLLAIASSVQNDMLAIVLSMLVTLLAATLLAKEQLTIVHSVALGLLVSVANLTKLTTAFWIPTLPVLMLWHFRRRGIVCAGAYLITIACCTGWWFARNYSLYGDITGGTAMRFYVSAETMRPVKLWEPSIALRWVRSLVTYYWLPFEYYRNIYHPPKWISTTVICLTGAAIIGCARAMISIRITSACAWMSSPRASVVFLQYAASLGLYAHAWLTATPLGARMTLPTVAAFAVLFWIGLSHFFRACGCSMESSHRRLVMFCGVFMLSVNAFVLWRFHSIGRFPFHI